jgi:hypothetical protein
VWEQLFISEEVEGYEATCFSIMAIALSRMKTTPVLPPKGSWKLQHQQGDHNINTVSVLSRF